MLSLRPLHITETSYPALKKESALSGFKVSKGRFSWQNSLTNSMIYERKIRKGQKERNFKAIKGTGEGALSKLIANGQGDISGTL